MNSGERFARNYTSKYYRNSVPVKKPGGDLKDEVIADNGF